MLSVLDVLLVILSATPASASPVRRWLNNSSVATSWSSKPAALPLNHTVTATLRHEAVDLAYTTSSDDCDDMSTAAYSSPTWPAALSTIQTRTIGANGAYDDDQTHTAPAQQYHQASSPASYGSSTSQATPRISSHGGAPPYAVTSEATHPNSTTTGPSGHGAAKPYVSSSLSGTTTLTLYTTIGPDVSSAPTATGAYSSAQSIGDNGGGTSEAASTFSGQATSFVAYSSLPSSSATATVSRGQSGPQSSPVAYSSPREAASSSFDTFSSLQSDRPIRTRHGNTHAVASQTEYPSAGVPSSSSPPAYPQPAQSSSTSSTVTVDPVPISYSAPPQAYSYSSQPSITTTTTTSAGSTAAATSAGGYPEPQHSYGNGTPWLPTLVTGSDASSAQTSSSSSSSLSSSPTTSSMAGITIVPVNPDAQTVYVTVTTTEAGMTTTVTGPTVTENA